jgi:hypothetical protein
VSFTIGAYGSDTPCIMPARASGTVLVKVKGSFSITAGGGEDRGYWVVGLNSRGSGGKRATFTIGSEHPMTGTFSLYFYSEPPEVATLAVKFGGCDVNTGDFGR